jgi:hypothetical protein
MNGSYPRTRLLGKCVSIFRRVRATLSLN